MKIAVVGLGFAGLAFSWYYLKNHPKDELTLFDPLPARERASARAFLLHPFIHFKSRLNWQGREAFSEAEKLLDAATPFSEKPFFIKRPFLKLANHPSLIESYSQAALEYPELIWEEKTSFAYPGIWVRSAYQIQSELYLEALEKACLSKGALRAQRYFEDKESYDFDRILISSGYQSASFYPHLKTSLVKGQLLTLQKPDDFDLLHAITAYKCHLVPSFDQKTILLGSTFERFFSSSSPSLEEAKKLLLPHLDGLWPSSTPLEILSVQSGIRLNAPQRLPLLAPLDNKRCLFSALGSKGLLYHAFLGKCLAHVFKEQKWELLPKETRFLNLP